MFWRSFSSALVLIGVVGLLPVWFDFQPEAPGDPGWHLWQASLVLVPVLLFASGVADFWPRRGGWRRRVLGWMRGLLAFGLATPYVYLYLLLPPPTISRTAANVCRREIRNYVQRSGLWPANLNEFCSAHKDGWNRALLVERADRNEVRVGTLGRDGTPGGHGSNADLWWPVWEQERSLRMPPPTEPRP